MAIKKHIQVHPLPKQQGDITTLPIDPDSPDGPGMKSIPVDQLKDLPIDQVNN